MNHLKAYESEAKTVGPKTSALEVSDVMDAENIGCVVVVDKRDRPLGIVTDRDLMSRVIVPGRDPEKCNAEDVMTPDPVTGDRDELLQPLIDKMREHKVRRIPILRDGHVVSILSVDDVLLDLGSQLSSVTGGIRVELRESNRWARKRRRQESREDAFEEVRAELSRLGHGAREKIRDEIGDLMDRLRGRSD